MKHDPSATGRSTEGGSIAKSDSIDGNKILNSLAVAGKIFNVPSES